jgi:hypothetical protein
MPAGFAAIDGSALPTCAASPASLHAANAALQQEIKALRFGLALAGLFGIKTTLPTTPSTAAQAAVLAQWVGAGCHGTPAMTPWAEGMVRRAISTDLR